MNKSFIRTINLILFFSIALSFNLKAQTFPASDFDPNLQQVIAFPGAEGFGKYATGGRGGQVIKVTNLNDEGPGSLRAAVEAIGPRIVVFDVSGTIELKSRLNVRNQDLTIAGQTAPGDGITIKNYPLRIESTNNVVIRFIRSRLGDLYVNHPTNPTNSEDAFEIVRSSMIIIDHCSFSWGTDEVASISHGLDITVQNSIFSEGLADYNSLGSLNYGDKLSLYQNLYVHNRIRNPALAKSNQFSNSLHDIRNIVVYNYSFRAIDGGSNSKVNIYNSYFKPGPATFANTDAQTISKKFLNPTRLENDPSTYGKFYLEGNYMPTIDLSKNQWLGVRMESGSAETEYLEQIKNKDSQGRLVPFAIPNNLYSNSRTAEQAYKFVLDFVGSSLKRDAVDTRIINEVRNGTYTFKGSNSGDLGIIDSQKDVGGWPLLQSLAAPKDTDGDGMPDAWEVSNGLEPNKVNDKEHNLSPYYTDIEVYLNSLVQDLIALQNPGVPKLVKLVLPGNNVIVSPVDISFAWDPVLNANLYTLQISKSNDFSSNVISVNNIKNYSLVHSSLDANSNYYWRVRASNSSGNGPYSTVGTFKTGSLNTVPGRTILTYPGNGNENISLTPIFNWAKVPNAKTYQIQVSTNSSFTTLPINQGNIVDNKFQSPRLQENQLYYWRVRASNDSGNGSFSSTGTFRTLSLDNRPEPVIALRPSNGVRIIPVPVQLDWLESSSAEQYQVEVSTNPEFSDITLINSNVQENFLLIPNLNPNTNYYWRVRGINRSGFGSFSIAHAFMTTGFSQKPDAIQILSPAHDSNVFSTSIQFQWAADPRSNSYRFQLSTSPDFSSFVTNVGGLTGTSRTIDNLSSNIDYYWRVQGINELGTGPFSNIHKVRAATFSGRPSATNLISPANQTVIGSNQTLFTWENQPNTESYSLEISENSDFSTNVIRRNGIRGTSFVENSLQSDKTYFWRIQTYNPAGSGKYSYIWSINTVSSDIYLNPPVLLLPVNSSNFSNSNINFSWESIADADAFHLQISEKTDFINLVYQNQNINSNNLNLSSLSSGKAYFWRIRARNNSIYSAWSKPNNFSIGSSDLLLLSGLLGYWPMEEGGGNRMLDQSSNNLHATIQNTGDVSWVNGKEGKAIRLNGQTGRYGVINHQSIMNIDKAITLAAWVKPSALNRANIFFKNAGNGFELWLDIDGQIEFRLNRGNNGTTYRMRSSFNYGGFLNQWIHVAATFDGITSTLYVNGVEDTSATYVPFEIGTTSGALTLGSMGTIQRWIGDLDELRIYNRVLSKNEILLLMGQIPDTEPPLTDPPTNPQSGNLIGYWKMDEGSGNQMLDHSGNNFHSNIQNTSGVSWTNGIIGQAISLNGFTNRFGITPHHPQLSLPNAISITAWVNPAELGRSTVISKSDGNGFELWLDINGQIEFRLNRGNNGSTYRLRSNFNYSNNMGNWMHVAATFDGSTSKIYINGQEDISKTYSPFTVGTNSGNLFIGSMGTIQRFTGSIDELRLYDFALNTAEIQALIDNAPPSPPLPSNLEGHWKMDEGSGNTMMDNSGNGNHANILNTDGVFWTTGVIGQAITLSGNSNRFGIAPHRPNLEIPKELTISAWVRPDEIGRNTIISKSKGNGFELWLDIDGQIEFRLNRGNNGATYRLRSNFNYSNQVGNWIHVAATFDGTTSKIYIDGKEDIAKSYLPFTIGTNSGDLVIGALGTIQRFEGSIDDLRLYSSALNSNDIQQLASNSQMMRMGSNSPKNNAEIAAIDSKILASPEIFAKKSDPLLYPNPVESLIKVMSLWEKEGEIKGQVYDMRGVLLMEQVLELKGFQIEIDLSPLRLKPGNYMLILQDAQHREIFRFIKK
ncbi:LamG-like jellyroll fold domain-containing protein [Aquiflexum balticum]|uniref:LamG-like jellyroll fold domain-containing protein n=1 Tax=Aquiflexum balticum TaxID=280473 RepID=UPI0015608E23|nr:LamG-like jellyroll fold domain-containing protein [Aquiflexum balticum]